MTDAYQRTIDYIRISVTDRCNLRCAYCMPTAGVERVPHVEILTYEEILRLCGVFARLGIRKIKVTGGEPLVRNGVVGLISGMKRIDGIEAVTLTTNGIRLERYLDALIHAGLDGVNISLDTLDPAIYQALTGSDKHARVMRAIDACAGRLPVKINCVPVGGINASELAAIAELARKTVAAVRFIELMPVGLAASYERITAARVKEILEAAHGTLHPCDGEIGNGPARYYAPDGFAGRIGIIDAVSHAFCDRCNRIRLTSEGRLKLCLAHEDGVNLKEALRGGGVSDAELAGMIAEAVMRKPRAHGFKNEAAHTVKMHRIGG